MRPVGGGIETDDDILYSTDGLAVSGIVAFPDVEESSPCTAESFGGLSFPYATLAGGFAAAALAAGGWYAGRRWLR